jgi:DnaK suppressor protein
LTADFKATRKVLEAQLKQATSGQAIGDSIRINQVADPLDMTQEAAARDVAVQLLDRESALVRRLRSAIDRINDGSYGVCLRCEEGIAPKRLKVIPWAELCIGCQEKADQMPSRRTHTFGVEQDEEAA